MTDERIIYRGVRMVPDWPERLREAQSVTTLVVGGVELPRVRHGAEAEDWGAAERPCHDCAAIKGEFHVPGCDVERCPACGGQVISCDCEFNESDF